MVRTIRALLYVLPLAALLVALSRPLGAAAAPPTLRPTPEAEPEPEPAPQSEPEVAPDSPLASMRTFLELCRAGSYEDAASFLELPRGSAADGPELARRLESVLDRRLPLKLAALSPLSTGTRNDELPRNVDRIGTIELDDGTTDPVTLVRQLQPTPRWVFTKATVARIDTWYAQLENYWLLANLPPALLTPGPRGVPRWQWIALPLLLCGAVVGGWLLARAGRLVVARMSPTLDRGLLVQITRPFTVIWALAILYATLPFLGVHSRAEAIIYTGLRTGFLLVVFWVLTSLLDISANLVMRSPWSAAHPSSSALVPLGRRISKVALVAILVVAVFADLGYPVASMLAGLGIGGLVVALAAQKTVENLFGAFAIGADQPFREGDYVHVEGLEGTVEAIGLRSTRFRTLDRTLVTVPNGKLADMRIESYAARDRMRITCTLGLVHGTTPAQLRAVLQGCEDVLRTHPKIWSEIILVRLCALGESSLDIEVMAWFQTTDWLELRQYRQEVLLGFMEVVQAAGTALAFPTRTVHLAGAAAPPGAA
jgi:MscS family membrane protein